MAVDFNRLTPTEFENLTYDLLSARGLGNTTWRTPGADGGRDIEGRWSHVDLSGEQTTEVWYVDCKRYSNSVDWPTVFKKLSYAVSNSADYLLIVCVPSISPACRNEIDKWNRTQTHPLVRTWEAHYLELLLVEYPDIAAKYGYAEKTVLQLPGFVDVVMEANKAAAAAYTRAVLLAENGPSKELEYAASLAGFAAEKMELYGVRNHLLETAWFQFSDDGYDWLDWSGAQKIDVDKSTLRTILCLVRLWGGGDRVIVEVQEPEVKVSVSTGRPGDVRNIDLIKKICLLGNVEYRLESNSIHLRSAKK